MRTSVFPQRRIDNSIIEHAKEYLCSIQKNNQGDGGGVGVVRFGIFLCDSRKGKNGLKNRFKSNKCNI